MSLLGTNELKHFTETHLGPYQTSMMEIFVKTHNVLKLLTIFA